MQTKFEVGKKYQGKYSGWVFTCLYSDDTGALFETFDIAKTRSTRITTGHDAFGNSYFEYVPPKVKKIGWVILYRAKADYWGNYGPTTSSGVFTSEEAALVTFNESTNSKKLAIAKVEWEE